MALVAEDEATNQPIPGSKTALAALALRWTFALVQPYPPSDRAILGHEERTRGPSYATTESERLTKVIPEAQASVPSALTPATPPAAGVTAQPTQNSKKGFFVLGKALPFFLGDLPHSDHAGVAVPVKRFPILISNGDIELHSLIADAAEWASGNNCHGMVRIV
jgi:hypothetical protein